MTRIITHNLLLALAVIISPALAQPLFYKNQSEVMQSAEQEQRLAEVARRGAQVMPFALAQTMHVFTKTAQGGVQQVLVKDKGNHAQIVLIRAHLSRIAQQFAQGDFSGPAGIHGDDMPGLAILRDAKPNQLHISYKDLADGGQIDYIGDSPQLIKALQQWFEAQLRDHAKHAVAGHAEHMQHHKP